MFIGSITGTVEPAEAGIVMYAVPAVLAAVTFYLKKKLGK